MGWQPLRLRPRYAPAEETLSKKTDTAPPLSHTHRSSLDLCSYHGAQIFVTPLNYLLVDDGLLQSSYHWSSSTQITYGCTDCCVGVHYLSVFRPKCDRSYCIHSLNYYYCPQSPSMLSIHTLQLRISEFLPPRTIRFFDYL